MSYEAWIIATGILVGVSCALIGTFLVLRNMAMLADAISHTVLLGIVGAFLVTGALNGIPMFIGAAASGLLTAFSYSFCTVKACSLTRLSVSFLRPCLRSASFCCLYTANMYILI